MKLLDVLNTRHLNVANVLMIQRYVDKKEHICALGLDYSRKETYCALQAQKVELLVDYTSKCALMQVLCVWSTIPHILRK